MRAPRPFRHVPLVVAAALVLFVAVGVVERRRAGPAASAHESGPTGSTDIGAASSERPASAPATGGPTAAREATRARIREAAGLTYLAETLALGDSALHRWADRAGRPVRVALGLAPGSGAGGEHFAALNWALARWNDVGLPVRLESGADTSEADVVVEWARAVPDERGGRADVAWNGRGEIVRARISLAVRFPDGTPLTAGERVAIALHELGHALGLGHSPDPADAMHPETAATALTARDRRTAELLYRLPAGSLKN